MATGPQPPAHVSGQSNRPLSRPAHGLSGAQVLQELASDAVRGLDAAEAARRLVELGANELEGKKGVRPLAILLEQMFNAMTLVLLLALAASLGIRAWIEGGLLGGIMVLNVAIGFAQSLHAEHTLDALRTLGSPTCRVLRDGGAGVVVPTAGVVPGDVVELAAGDSVPGDVRLLDAAGLEADEALLTGESAPVTKAPGLVLGDDTGPGDRLNVVFSSSTITKGRGRGVVFATGMCTEIGLIARALQGGGKPADADADLDADAGGWAGPVRAGIRRGGRAAAGWAGAFLGLSVGTPLQRKLAQLFLWLLALAVVCAVVVLGANRFDTRKDVVLYAVTTAMGTIPVSLLLVLTVTMAAGTKKMVQRHVIVRNLQSLEALGGVTNICSDKTGTLTQGRMVARRAWLPGCGTYSVDAGGGHDVHDPTAGSVARHAEQPKDGPGDGPARVAPSAEPAARPALRWFLNTAALSSLATLERVDDGAAEKGRWRAHGAPTDVAIDVFAARFGWSRAALCEAPGAPWARVAELPFDSEVKRMTVVFRDVASGETHVFTKGAAERVLDICDGIAVGDDGAPQPLDAAARADVLARMDALAGEGLRVLALAHTATEQPVPEPGAGAAPDRAALERGLVLGGLVGICDPPRPESLPSVRMCQRAGIAVHMLTGDHAQTARAMAADVGILPAGGGGLVMTARDLDALSDAQVDALPQLPLVVARCAPSTKVRMIDALHRRGCYVAMTGDGVNDGPSLRRADIGIAMGSGSDVAKESADIVLTDDNFASILNAIEEGRRIFDNIQKFMLHVLAANLGFVVALLTGLAFKDGSGVSVFLLTPVEILWMLMGTGAFCETGLGFEKAVPDVLRRPPHDLRYGVFSPEFLLDMVVYGVVMACCTMGSFAVVVFGFSNGNLGAGCNDGYSPACDGVFRARATCYSTMTCIFLLFAWELIDARRSLFLMPHGARAWAAHLWGNRFLFLSVTIVFLVVFPTLYVPVINHVVFMHTGISWEWAVVFVAVTVFMLAAESWKWAKRVHARRRGAGRGWSGVEE